MPFPEYIPGPNNELVPAKLRPTGSYPVSADFATSASYSETASFILGYILSSSYAEFASTASYLLGSIANAVSASWAEFSGHSLTSVSASWSDNSGTASYAYTASYALNNESSISSSYLSGSSATIQRVILTNAASSAYIMSQHMTGIEFATAVDQFPITDGNSVKWTISINDGSSYKISEIIATCDAVTNSSSFAEVTTNAIGFVPVAMSVNTSSGSINLVANPASGSWTVKSIRFVL
jgi:hypothetical protein